MMKSTMLFDLHCVCVVADMIAREYGFTLADMIL